MIRVISHFDTQIRIPVMGDTAHTAPMSERKTPLGMNGMQPRPNIQPHLKQGPVSKAMTANQMITWFSKILDGVKQRYRKLQRLAR